MTPQAQRIAIAKACGWKDARLGYGALPMGIPPEGGKRFPFPDPHDVADYLKPYHGLPDYPNDLNAMHEAEKVLTDKQVNAYVTTLCLEVQPEPSLWNATAAQRAEAFLRAIGKWDSTSVKEAQP